MRPSLIICLSPALIFSFFGFAFVESGDVRGAAKLTARGLADLAIVANSAIFVPQRLMYDVLRERIRNIR